MTQPLTELAIAAAIVAAIGAGTIAVLPPSQPRSTTVIELKPGSPPARRQEPDLPKSDAERVEALQLQLLAIAAEQKRLTQDIRMITRERRPK